MFQKIFLYAVDENNEHHFIHSFLDHASALKHATKHHSLSVGYSAYYYMKGEEVVWLISKE